MFPDGLDVHRTLKSNVDEMLGAMSIQLGIGFRISC